MPVVRDFYLQGQPTDGDLRHAIRARFHYSRRAMPVLIPSGAEVDVKQTDLFHAGANDFVSKPIVEQVLMARIGCLLLIRQQFAELKRRSDVRRRLAVTNDVTGIYSRRHLLDQGGQFVASCNNNPVAALRPAGIASIGLPLTRLLNHADKVPLCRQRTGEKPFLYMFLICFFIFATAGRGTGRNFFSR